ncbi:MAG: cyclic pyranopterin monophosphate synthase MoaC [Planctomycetes bacterium]|nr:cyclic pyranopterin monophosphate synthase MoaC [Planctomycetota bacterium]
MIDVSGKPPVFRTARAEGVVRMRAETALAIREGRVPKGDVLGTARVAGIMAAKRTPEFIPLCHPITLTYVEVDLKTGRDAVQIEVLTRAVDKTGVEMEALTAVAAACLSVYDMCKGIDPEMTIGPIRLVEKTKEPVPET